MLQPGHQRVEELSVGAHLDQPDPRADVASSDDERLSGALDRRGEQPAAQPADRRRRGIEEFEPCPLDVDPGLVRPAAAIGAARAGQLSDQPVPPAACSPLESPEAPARRADGTGRPPRRSQQEPRVVARITPSARQEPAAGEKGAGRRLRHPRPVAPRAGATPLVGHAQPVPRPARPVAMKLRRVAREVEPAVPRAKMRSTLDRLVGPGPRQGRERGRRRQHRERGTQDRGAGRLRPLARWQLPPHG